MSKVLIDTSVVLNIVPFSIMKKLGKGRKDLIETNMNLSNVTGESTLALGFLIAKSMTGSKTTLALVGMDSCQPMCAIYPSSTIIVLEWR